MIEKIEKQIYTSFIKIYGDDAIDQELLGDFMHIENVNCKDSYLSFHNYSGAYETPCKSETEAIYLDGQYLCYADEYDNSYTYHKDLPFIPVKYMKYYIQNDLQNDSE